MPAKALFQSQRATDVAVAAVMAAVLLLSLGAAYALAAQRRPVSIETTRLSLGGLSLQMLDSWRDASTADLDPKLSPRRLIDPDRPHRMLTLLRVPTTAPTDPVAIMQATLPTLLGTARAQPLDGIAEVPHPSLIVIEWNLLSPTTRNEIRTHQAAVVHGGPTLHWVIYMTDRVQPGENPAAVMQANLSLMRAVIRSATLDDDLAPSGDFDE